MSEGGYLFAELFLPNWSLYRKACLLSTINYTKNSPVPTNSYLCLYIYVCFNNPHVYLNIVHLYITPYLNVLQSLTILPTSPADLSLERVYDIKVDLNYQLKLERFSLGLRLYESAVYVKHWNKLGINSLVVIDARARSTCHIASRSSLEFDEAALFVLLIRFFVILYCRHHLCQRKNFIMTPKLNY